MATIDTIRKLTVIAADHGLTQLNAKLAALAAAGGNVSNAQTAMAATATTAARGGASLENQIKSLERRLIPAAKDAQELDRAMRNVFAAAAQGTVDVRRLQAISDAAIANTSGVKAQGAETARLTRFIKELEQSTMPAVAAQKRMLEQTVMLGNAQRQGIVGASQAAAMQKQLEHNATLSAKGIGLTTSQVTNLSYQLNDVVSGLVMGQSPFTIMAQQGGQVYQALQGPRGVGQGIKDATSALFSLVTPARAAGALLVGAAVEGFFAWNRLSTQQIEVTRTLRSQAVYLGLTTEAFMRMSAAAAEAGNLSGRVATDVAQDIAKAGRFHVDTIAKMTAATKNFAATTGIEASGAGKAFGQALSSLNGILELNATRVRFLSGPEIEHIDRLFAQGKAADASAFAVDKLIKVLIPAKDVTTAAASAWGLLTRAISEGDRALGQYLVTFADYLAKSNAAKNVGDFLTPPGSVGEKLFKGGPKPAAPVAAPAASTKVQYAETEEQVRALEQVMSKYVETSSEVAAADSKTREQNQYLSDQVREAGKMFRTGSDQQREYLDAAEKIRNAEKGMSDEMYKAAQSMQGQENIMDRLVTAIRSYNSARGEGAKMTDEQVTLRTHEIELELATKLTFARRQQLELERGFLEQRGKLQTAAESEINTNRSLNLQLVQRRRTIEDDKDATLRNSEAQLQVGRAREVNLEVLQRQIQYEQQNLPLTEAEAASLRKVVEVSLQRNSVGQQMNRIYGEFRQPAIDFNNALDAATRLLKAGEINATQFGYALIDMQIRMEQSSKTMQGGIRAGLLTVQRDFGDTSKLMEGFVTSAAGSMVTAIADMTDGTKSAKDGFRDLAKTVIRSLEEMVIKMMIVAPIAKALQSVMSGGFGLFGGGAAPGTVKVGPVHFGGLVTGYGVKRDVDPSVFLGAQRYHNGGIVSGEVPAILRRNEEVLTPGDPRHRDNGGGGMTLNVNVSGARGNSEIMDMVYAGVRQGISGYDASLNQGGLARKMSNVRIRGQR